MPIRSETQPPRTQVSCDSSSPAGESIGEPSPGRKVLRGGRLWSAWVAANAIGELAGLAIPAVIGVTLSRQIGPAAGKAAELAGAGAMVLAGTLEGLIVGFAQWRVLR